MSGDRRTVLAAATCLTDPEPWESSVYRNSPNDRARSRLTTALNIQVTCASCGRESTHTEIGSTYIAGPPDLDARPGEMQRSTMEYWIQKCPHCGYVNTEIKSATPEALVVVRSHTYQAQLRDQTVPELATRFLCYSMIEEALGNPVEAGWASLHAAWACDDVRNSVAASRYRRRALTFFEKATAVGQMIMSQEYDEYPLVVDLWRRIGEFDQARDSCKHAMAVLSDAIKHQHRGWPVEKPKELRIIQRILMFEKKLIRSRDSEVHSLGEVITRASTGKVD